MAGTRLYWLEGPWQGRFALAARPRGGEWLNDEIIAWQNMGAGVVLSLLTSDEETDLGLRNERKEVQTHGMKFLALPIPDRQVPISESELSAVLEVVNAELGSGKNVVIHCRQGVGRSGLVAACLLVSRGADPNTAVNKVSKARGVPVPETPEQRDWIDRYAGILSSHKINVGSVSTRSR